MSNDSLLFEFSRFYTAFLMRDVAYVLSGGAFLLAIFLPFCSEINWETIPTILVVAVVLLSYFSGIFIQQVFSMLKICRLSPADYSNWPQVRTIQWLFSFFYRADWQPAKQTKTHYYSLLNELNRSIHPNAMLAVERIIYIKHIGAALASSSILALPILTLHWSLHYLSISCEQLLLTICVLSVVGFFSLQLNWRAWKIQFMTIEQMLQATANAQSGKSKSR